MAEESKAKPNPFLPLPTVRVVASDPKEQGPFIVINESDFDPKVHTLYKEPAKKPASKGEGTGEAGATK